MNVPRDRLLKLAADIDQQIAEAEALAADADLDEADRQRAVEQLTELRTVLERLQNLLGKGENDG